MSVASSKQQPTPIEMAAMIEGFLRDCRRPAAVEDEQAPIRFEHGGHAVEVHGKQCVLHVWGEEGNIVRRVLSVRSRAVGRLELNVRRFGAKASTLTLRDSGAHREALHRITQQIEFREFLRRILTRDFGDWEIEKLLSSADLENSLSPIYTRGVLRRGSRLWAVIGCRDDRAACDRILTFGLIWLDWVSRRTEHRVIAGLKIFLPYRTIRTTANRLAFLNRDAFQFELYGFDPQGGLTLTDPNDFGNLATRLPVRAAPAEPTGATAARLSGLSARPGVETVERADGARSFRINGMEFARQTGVAVTHGLSEKVIVSDRTFDEIDRLAEELARFRSANAADTLNPLYCNYPESWLESQVRSSIERVHGSLLPHPVHSHVPAVAGADRGIVDLLACDRNGRLVVLELKVEEDIPLPLQSLDYWMRAKWHLDRGEFSARGYFPGIELSPAAPRLLLVAPAFVFHPTTEIILRYFSPEIAVERVGLGADWRRELRVLFRKKGAARLA